MTGVETPELAPDILLDKTRFLVGVVMLMILVLRQVRFISGPGCRMFGWSPDFSL